MKKIFQILAFIIGCFCIIQTAIAQNEETSLRDRLAKKQQSQTQTQNATNVPKISVRAEMMNNEQTQDISNATWMREVYRFIDLNKGANAPIYYPTRPIDDRMSLYTMIFKLLANNDITVYDFLGNQEVFNDQYKVNFESMAKRLEFPFKKNGNTYTYEEYDIPSNEVKGYYIKEAWYFDQSNSVVDVKTIAICPIIFREEFNDFGSVNAMPQRHPQFWVPYESIRPYAARIHIITSDMNNVMNKTIDDFFRLRLYDGEIYKVTNMENKNLNEKYKTPEELKQAQIKIEDELKLFEKNLWVVNDSTTLQTNAKKGKDRPKEYKSKKIKSSGANATYSVRDRR